MDINFLNDYLLTVIVGVCLCIGYILKNIIPTETINKYIPLIMGIIGLFMAIWINEWVITPQIILTGLFSGLASTGLYEVFRNLIKENMHSTNNKENDKD